MNAPAIPSKDHQGENFPVASILIAPRHRPVVLAFYRVARLSDDIADQPGASSAEKLAGLARVESTLLGETDAVPEAAVLRETLAARGLTNAHILDLLTAFRRDATQNRYADWAELMDYCRYSAAPVGRFMLDVHGEPASTWPASDALCAALQVINHLQDCGKDYRDIDRVYVPQAALAKAGVEVSALGAPAASAAVRGVIADLAARTQDLLATSRALAGGVRDTRLGLEISVIQRIAEDLAERLRSQDPLSQRVHHRKAEAAALALAGVGRFVTGRLRLNNARKLGPKDVAEGGARS